VLVYGFGYLPIQTPYPWFLDKFQSLLLWDSMVLTSPYSSSFLSSFLYSFLAQPISSTQYSLVSTNDNKTICWSTISYILSKVNDPGFMSVWGSNKASKNIGPPGKPEGNTVHRMRCIVSPKIDLMGGCNTHVFIA
jgi:hypothetical protein